MAYARWLSEKTGKPWRLPYELEFEKASRGVDARYFPMGNYYDPTWILTDDTHAIIPAGKNDFPRDRSIYGCRYLAGNVADWCLGAGTTELPFDAEGRHLRLYDELEEPTLEFSCRGGASFVNQRYTRGSYRQFYLSDTRWNVVSFRVTRPITSRNV